MKPALKPAWLLEVRSQNRPILGANCRTRVIVIYNYHTTITSHQDSWYVELAGLLPSKALKGRLKPLINEVLLGFTVFSPSYGADCFEYVGRERGLVPLDPRRAQVGWQGFKLAAV
ncbi:hypothetical protein [Pseudogulbenkiania sp. MAI-1]|uniref:hypothetical protein n=1 Tax=Pseudogulbenkiania sp. MAI-1 TaxID=990370 RepID=UPI0018DE5F08|nr:hypothetical protein [Pseudogulbenkiania sp. MAI-1]